MLKQSELLLTRKFSLVAIPIIVFCVLISGLASWRNGVGNLKAQGEHVNVVLGKSIINAYQEHFIGYLIGVSNRDVSPDFAFNVITSSLEEPVSVLIADTDVVKVNIFTPNGYAVFSTTPKRKGKIIDLESSSIESHVEDGRVCGNQ